MKNVVMGRLFGDWGYSEVSPISFDGEYDKTRKFNYLNAPGKESAVLTSWIL